MLLHGSELYWNTAIGKSYFIGDEAANFAKRNIKNFDSIKLMGFLRGFSQIRPFTE